MNKLKVHKIGCRKILHKVRKHWVTISLSLLMMLGSGAVATNTVSASSNNSQTITSNRQVKNQPQSQNSKQNVINKAKKLHQNVLTNAVNQNNSKSVGQSTDAKNNLKNQSDKQSNQNNKNRYQIAKPVNLKDSDGSDENTYDGLHYTSDMNGNVKFTSGTLTWNGNDTSSDSFLGMNAPISVSQASSITFGSDVDTSHVTNMSYMFSDTSASIDLGKHFDTSNVTDMSHMFEDNYDDNSWYLTLPSDFNTSKVTNMSHMFNNIGYLNSLKLSKNFDTGNVTDMDSMFKGDTDINSLDLLSKFNTSKVSDMTYMFSSDCSIPSLILPDNFDTSNVRYMHGMFENDNSLQKLILSKNFDTDKAAFVTPDDSDQVNMFASTDKLNYLKIQSPLTRFDHPFLDSWNWYKDGSSDKTDLMSDVSHVGLWLKYPHIITASDAVHKTKLINVWNLPKTSFVSQIVNDFSNFVDIIKNHKNYYKLTSLIKEYGINHILNDLTQSIKYLIQNHLLNDFNAFKNVYKQQKTNIDALKLFYSISSSAGSDTGQTISDNSLFKFLRDKFCNPQFWTIKEYKNPKELIFVDSMKNTHYLLDLFDKNEWIIPSIMYKKIIKLSLNYEKSIGNTTSEDVINGILDYYSSGISGLLTSIPAIGNIVKWTEDQVSNILIHSSQVNDITEYINNRLTHQYYYIQGIKDVIKILSPIRIGDGCIVPPDDYFQILSNYKIKQSIDYAMRKN